MNKKKQKLKLHYKESVHVFEKIATELYKLLKKKEDTINAQHELLQKGLSIDEMNHYSKYH